MKCTAQRRLIRLGECPGWSESGHLCEYLIYLGRISAVGTFSVVTKTGTWKVRTMITADNSLVVKCSLTISSAPIAAPKTVVIFISIRNKIHFTVLLNKFPKYSDTQSICCNRSKIWTMWLYHRVMSPNDADGMANSVDPEQSDLGLHCLPRHIYQKT